MSASMYDVLSTSKLLYLIQFAILTFFCESAFKHHNKDCPVKFPKQVATKGGKEWHHLPLICRNVDKFSTNELKCTVENCGDCIPPWSTTMEQENQRTKQWTEYYNKEFKTSTKLKSVLSSHDISNNDEDPLILTVVHREELFLFLNFLCSLQHHSISGVRERILVIPMDSETSTEIESIGVMTFTPSFFNETNSSNAAATYLAVLTDLVHLGYNVVVQHTDVVWTRNVFTYLKQPHFDRLDVQMAVGRDGEWGPGDTQFMFIKSSCKMKRFMDTTIHLIGLVLMSGSDEVFWNMLLHEDQFRQIHVELLDTTRFVDVVDGQKPSDTVHLIHGSETADHFERAEQLNYYDAWYLNADQCPDLWDQKWSDLAMFKRSKL